MKRFATIGLLCCVAAFTTFGHDGDHNGNNNNNNHNNNNQNGANGQFEAALVGSTPGAMIGGVASGGAPWVIGESEASLSANGQIHVQVNGLLIGGTNAPANLVGTVGPVQMVAASVVCGGAGGMVVASTDGVPLSSLGFADIQGMVTMPASCMAPVVLVRIFVASLPIGSQLGPFIAVTGLGPASTSQTQNGNSGRDHD